MFVLKNFDGIEYGDTSSNTSQVNGKLTSLAYDLFEVQEDDIAIDYNALASFLSGDELGNRETIKKFLDFSSVMQETKSNIAELMGEFLEGRKDEIDQEVAEKLMLLAQKETEPNFSHNTMFRKLSNRVNDIVKELQTSNAKITDTDAFAESLEQATINSDQGNLE